MSKDSIVSKSDAERIVKILARAHKEICSFAPGWNDAKFSERLQRICQYATSNRYVIPLARRRRIARLATDVLGSLGEVEGVFGPSLEKLAEMGRFGARELRSELAGLGGLDGEIREILLALAGDEAKKIVPLNHGGDRRSGEHTLKGSLLRMAVLLYCEAHAKPGFAVNGPICRFANAIGELTLGQSDAFSPGAVRAAHQRMKGKARRLPPIGTFYHPDQF